MHKRVLTKPDGRPLILYAHQPLPDTLDAPSPSTTPHAPNPHLRWHPLRGEWVAYAGHRQHRTFLPPAAYNPLAPSTDPAHPTEVPSGPWEVAVFENQFPTFALSAHDPPELPVPTAPGRGVCEVVVFTQDATASLGTLPLRHLELLIDVWADRYEDLGSREDIAYVYPFENRGVEVGVTLHHPHGQIYAYPYVTPRTERLLASIDAYGPTLMADILERERTGPRMLLSGEHWTAFVPFAARWPIEVHLLPHRHVPDFAETTLAERDELAGLYLRLLRGIFGESESPTPYIAAWHQAPFGALEEFEGVNREDFALHLELFTIRRTSGKLKFLAGSESGMGAFINDIAPERAAERLREVASS